MAYFVWILLFSYCALLSKSDACRCKDENNRNVDWFIVYKLPSLETSKAPFNSGKAYAYLTSRRKSKWNIGKKLIDEGSLLWNTYSQIHNDYRNIDYLQYNDREPDSKTTKSNQGHMKGAVAFKNNGGIWVMHSVPAFGQPFDKKLEYPNSGKNNGQIFICLSLEAKQFPEILKQLLVMRPNIYDHHASPQTLEKYPEFNQLITRKWSKEQIRKTKIQTRGKVEFESIAKSPLFETELYQELSDEMKSSMFVQSWRNGAGGKLDSKCGIRAIRNVNNLKLNTDNKNDSISWKSTEDHSKWAVGSKESSPFSCIGDINRIDSQKNRGGGILCMKEEDSWHRFQETIGEVEDCK